MIKKTITYVDFDGNKRTEGFYFNLTKTELTKMQNSELGGLTKLLEKIIQEDNNVKIVEFFDKFLELSYGVKSLDGKQFIKNKEVWEAFFYSAAYDVLFQELFADEKAAANFVKAVVPPMDEDAIAEVTNQ